MFVLLLPVPLNPKAIIVSEKASDVKIESFAVNSSVFERINLPSGVTSIADYALCGNWKPKNLTIYGTAASAADIYAKKIGVKFSTETYTLGDVNNDKKINASDALQDLRHSVNEIQLKGTEFSAGDVTKDGTINASDALQILRYSVSEITSF